jgi:hypothetical protein
MPLDRLGAIYYSLAMNEEISAAEYRRTAWAYSPSFKRQHPEIFNTSDRLPARPGRPGPRPNVETLTPSERQDATHRRNFAWLFDYLTRRGCACGETDVRVLDLHHRDPEQKEFNITAQLWNYSLDRVQAEVLKCDVICANCHRRRHSQRLTHAASYKLMTLDAVFKYTQKHTAPDLFDNSPGHTAST